MSQPGAHPVTGCSTHEVLKWWSHNHQISSLCTVRANIWQMPILDYSMLRMPPVDRKSMMDCSTYLCLSLYVSRQLTICHNLYVIHSGMHNKCNLSEMSAMTWSYLLRPQMILAAMFKTPWSLFWVIAIVPAKQHWQQSDSAILSMGGGDVAAMLLMSFTFAWKNIRQRHWHLGRLGSSAYSSSLCRQC